MDTKTIPQSALEVIKGYKNVPYFNNKSVGRRAGIGVEIGKGSPKEIMEELETIGRQEKIDIKSLSDIDQKRFMVEHNIGIECSGFVYHVLSAFGKGELKNNLKFPYTKGILGLFRSYFRAIHNTNVKTFAHEQNSKVISIEKIQVGDIIAMLGERDHILLIEKIDFQNSIPKNIYYIHAMTWPSDGEYGHGIHEGKIEIIDLQKPIVDQNWIELGKTGEENYTYARAKKSMTELRRLNWF